VSPFKNKFPPHDKNTYPYYGEGDKGGEVTNIRREVYNPVCEMNKLS
jgi:hypothetical protein